MSPVPRLRLISNLEICSRDAFPGVVEAAVRGGVDAVHLREPGLDDAELQVMAKRVRSAITGSPAHLVINRSVSVAVAVQADGIHLSESQMTEIGAARDYVPETTLIGVSVHSVDSATAAVEAGADYIIAGHVFETGSKPGLAGRGLAFIQEVAAQVSIPVIAVGGITPGNTPDVIGAGAHGVAVLSGILEADDPEATSRDYADAIQGVVSR